ncbi:MAG: hypothetical protein K0M78_03240 [Brevundimonas sp.]|nr:hypothetical protein [Brevundimonas sp.]
MSTAFSLRLDIEKHGWARFTVSDGDRTFETRGVSDLTDALGDMVRAAADMAEGAERSVFSFDGEPVETRVTLDRLSAADLRIRVVQYADIYRPSALETGDERISTTVPVAAFARTVLREADRIRSATGDEAYERNWGEAYPARDVEILRAALRI